MNPKVKEVLRSWERTMRYSMPLGGKMTLSFIIEEERSRAKNNPTDVAMPEFLNNINPCLYHLFVIDWSKINNKRIPAKFRGDGILFLRDVLEEWLKECGKKNYFTDGMFSSFENVKQVEDAIGHFTDSRLSYLDEQGKPSTDYVEMEFRMGEYQQEIARQQQLADQKAREQKELEAKARRKQEEAERKAAKQSAAATASKASEGCARGTIAPSIDQLMLEAQQLFDQSPLPRVSMHLYVRPHDTAEPYAAELLWDNSGQAKRQPDLFTAPSFAIAISKAKTHVSQLIDQLINEQQKEKQRQAIEQQISEQNDAYQKQMEENHRMIQQMQEMMAEQQRQHEAQVGLLRQKMQSL